MRELDERPHVMKGPISAHGAFTASGTGAAFAQFYQDSADDVRRALVATLGDSDLAAEATQEAMARAWSHWDEVSGLANPPGWVYRVGLNWSRSWIRRLAREILRTAPDTTRDEQSGGADIDLWRALQGLSLDHRAVLILRFLLDWPIEDVAAALGVPEGTVKSRQHWALKRLEEVMRHG